MKSMSGVTRVSLAEIYRFCETPTQCSFEWQLKSIFSGSNYNMNWGRNKNAGESAKCLLHVACSSLKALKPPILITESLNIVVSWFCSVLLSSSATFMSCAFTERKIKATFIWWFKYRDTQRHVWQANLCWKTIFHPSMESLIWQHLREMKSGTIILIPQQSFCPFFLFLIFLSFFSIPGRIFTSNPPLWNPSRETFNPKGSFVFKCITKKREGHHFW